MSKFGRITNLKKMKKLTLLAFIFVAVVSIVLVSCKSKNDSNAITPTYKEEGGTGGNPNQGVTTTGTVVQNNNPTSNSALTVGGGSWSTPGCTTGQKVVTMTNQSTGTTVQLFFNAPPVTGSYTTISSNNPATGEVYILVSNPPGQPANSQWSSTAGKTVTVTVGGSPASINAVFSSIGCLQIGGLTFFTVTISGNAGCV